VEKKQRRVQGVLQEARTDAWIGRATGGSS
jgi:hypothetical protein